MPMPAIGQIYTHYKTDTLYQVVGRAEHTERQETLILYQRYGQPDSIIWARPRVDFLARLPDGRDRFRLISYEEDHPQHALAQTLL